MGENGQGMEIKINNKATENQIARALNLALSISLRLALADPIDAMVRAMNIVPICSIPKKRVVRS